MRSGRGSSLADRSVRKKDGRYFLGGALNDFFIFVHADKPKIKIIAPFQNIA